MQITLEWGKTPLIEQCLLEFLPVESPIYEIWVLPWGQKSNKLC